MNESDLSMLEELQPVTTQMSERRAAQNEANRRTAAEKLKELEKRVLKMAEGNSLLEQGINELKCDVAALSAERESVRSRLAAAKEIQEDLENGLVEVLVRRSQLEQLIEKREQENSRLEEICTRTSGSLERLRTRMTALEQEIPEHIKNSLHRDKDSSRHSESDAEEDKENNY
ncbi:hypothetical protein Q1695_014726 [Nippostrongylus brasiliensis]|nr:hypothetical protein Q1695_014726 [Nippostrongylus brasiliensis]